MRYFAPLIVSLLLGAFLSSPLEAQPFRARQGVQSGTVRSLGEILNGIRRERPGSLSDVQGPVAGPQGEPHYRLKWLTPDGRVLWLDTDARTGRVLGVEGDDRGPPGPSRGGFFTQRRGNFPPDESSGPPPGYGPGPPPGYDRGPPPGYQRGFPGPGAGPPEPGPRGRFGRYRNGR